MRGLPARGARSGAFALAGLALARGVRGALLVEAEGERLEQALLDRGVERLLERHCMPVCCARDLLESVLLQDAERPDRMREADCSGVDKSLFVAPVAGALQSVQGHSDHGPIVRAASACGSSGWLFHRPSLEHASVVT